VRKFPHCFENDIQHEVAGDHPQSQRSQCQNNDLAAAMSISKGTADAAPHQQNRHSWRNDDKEATLVPFSGGLGVLALGQRILLFV
jgi:hypothetical protein